MENKCTNPDGPGAGKGQGMGPGPGQGKGPGVSAGQGPGVKRGQGLGAQQRKKRWFEMGRVFGSKLSGK